jgi:hypothetical protein
MTWRYRILWPLLGLLTLGLVTFVHLCAWAMSLRDYVRDWWSARPSQVRRSVPPCE